ncbi:hypothetical protein TNCV_451881 [Trichonephila clavipes]|nr:hypothetical protein TNCV_451881 [Trichonephila clavipes]
MINNTNEWRHETPLRMKGDIEDVSSELGNGEFRIQVVEELLHKYDVVYSGSRNPGRPPPVDNPARLSERYFISDSPPTPVKREHTRQ